MKAKGTTSLKQKTTQRSEERAKGGWLMKKTTQRACLLSIPTKAWLQAMLCHQRKERRRCEAQGYSHGQGSPQMWRRVWRDGGDSRIISEADKEHWAGESHRQPIGETMS